MGEFCDYFYLQSSVDTIIGIVDENPEAKEAGLAHLCEFIEDCEHTVRCEDVFDFVR